MREVSLAWFGRRWLVAVLLGAAGGAVSGCSSESNDFRRKPHDHGGGSGSGGSGAEGGTAPSTGGSGGSAQGGQGGSGQAGGGSSPGGTGGSGASDTGGSAGTDAGSGGVSDGGSDCGGPVTDGEAMSYSRRARSSGWSGTDAQYSELYDVPCSSVDDCIDPCTTRGGTEAMCAASICVDSTSDYCLPPTAWRNLGALRSEGTGPEDGAELVLVYNPYEDVLLLDDFRLEVPAGAEIVGITVTVRRAGGSSMEAVDGAVHLIKGGVVGSSDRALPTPWTGPEYASIAYGGPTDLWGQTWTPAEVNAQNFGVALSAIYADTAGNGRAYVDIVYVTVSYRTTCE
jgi:hypothetical protein